MYWSWMRVASVAMARDSGSAATMEGPWLEYLSSTYCAITCSNTEQPQFREPAFAAGQQLHFDGEPRWWLQDRG